ncbi:MAG: DUF126 domain-containing protein [Synergistaceae bacterium]|jgi:predicted aconitase with swiveling domain|nr:DUF126 domain-containing protein [Synergistaceae bacterium]
MGKILIRGRPAFPGKAAGEAIVCPDSIQGWSGVSDKTGIIIEEANPEKGKCIAGKILVLPYGKGSTGWSGHFHSASVAGFTPAGWLFSRIDSRSGVATAVLSIPTVADFPDDVDLFEIIESGDFVEIDGDTGEVIVTKK